MNPNKRKATFLKNKIEKFKERWGYQELRIRIKFWNKDYAEYQGFLDGYGVIKLNPNQSKKTLLQDCMHEIAHALKDQFDVPGSMLKIFRENCPNSGHAWYQKIDFEEKTPPPKGEVSWYGLVSGTESYCEVFSAWVCSGYKTRGWIEYGSWLHNIDKDKELQRKIKQIHKILSLK